MNIIYFCAPRRELKKTSHGGVFLTKVEVIGNVVKHCLECLIYLLNRN